MQDLVCELLKVSGILFTRPAADPPTCGHSQLIHFAGQASHQQSRRAFEQTGADYQVQAEGGESGRESLQHSRLRLHGKIRADGYSSHSFVLAQLADANARRKPLQ